MRVAGSRGDSYSASDKNRLMMSSLTPLTGTR